jgi:hypothetical protein
MQQAGPQDKEVDRFRAEAAQLLGVAQPQPPTEFSDQPQSTKPSSPK